MAKEPTTAQLIADSVYFTTLGNQPLASHTPENVKRIAASAILAGVAFQAAWEEWERSSAQVLMDKAKAKKDQADAPAAAQPERKLKAKRAKRKSAH